MAGLHGGRQLRGEPVGHDVEVFVGVTAFRQPPGHRRSSQSRCARGDVDLRELGCHRLEGSQWATELVPVGYVVSGEAYRARYQSGGIGSHRRQRQLVQSVHAATLEDGIDCGVSEFDGELVTTGRGGSLGDTHPVVIRRHHGNTAVGADQDPRRLAGIGNSDLGAGDPAVDHCRRGSLRQGRTGLVERGGEDRALCHPRQVAVLLRIVGQIEQREQTQAEGGECGTHRRVAADLGEGGGNLRQSDTVAAKPFGNSQRRHTSGNQRLPTVVAVQDRVHDVGDGLLFRLRGEIHAGLPTIRYAEVEPV